MIEEIEKMALKKGIYFHKLKTEGKSVEVLVSGKLVDNPLIQMNIEKSKTHARITKSILMNDCLAYKIKDPEDVDWILRQIEQVARSKYNPRGILKFFFRPKIEIKYHK